MVERKKQNVLDDRNVMPWEREGPGVGEDDTDLAQGFIGIVGSDPAFSEFHEDGDDEEPAADDADASDQEDDDSEDVDDVEEDVSDAEEEADEEAGETVEEAIELDDELIVAVKIDGEEKQVTLREALDGYQRQSDYTKKTQSLAAERNQYVEGLRQTSAVREALGEQLALLEQALSEDSTPPDWEKLREEDPTRFANEWAAHQLRQDKLRQVKALREQNEAARADEQKQVTQARLVEEWNKLSEVIPEFKDPAKGEQGLKEIYSYLRESYNASDEELNNILDHRFVVMAQKAMLYDRARTKGKENLRQQRKRGVRVLKPGAKATDEGVARGSKRASKPKIKAYQRAKKRLAATGRVEDAAAALLAFEDAQG